MAKLCALTGLPWRPAVVTLALAFVWVIGSGCRVALPQGESEATAAWRGTWSSEQRPFVNGQVSFRLPDPLPTEGRYVAPARFETAMLLLSTGKTTAEVEMDLVAEPLPDKAHAAPENPAAYLRLTTSGRFGVKDQVVVYEATVKRRDEVITGTYSSVKPSDRGRFRVERVREEGQQLPLRSSEDNGG
ncbi:MAG: hypothetical protein AAGH99_00435 [Planctomycetota bacterium]